MARYTFMVLSNPVAGREAEYNEWYTNRHVSDVLRVPGVNSAQRFRLVGKEGQWYYMALYELETADPVSVIAELRRRANTPAMIMSEAMDRTTLFSAIFAPLGAALTSLPGESASSPA